MTPTDRMGYSVARRPSLAIWHRGDTVLWRRQQVGLFARPDQPWRAPRGETALCGVALFVVLMAVWLLNSGHYTPLLIGFGVASSLFVVYLSWRMGIVDREGLPVHLIPRGLRYGPWLFKEIFTANVDVAKRTLTPYEPDISPRIFDTGVTQKCDLGRVIYANSITLTPGTVSIGVKGSYITVHAIAEEVADGLQEGEMDRRVTWLEGEGS
jgi:multicomponent Na+:H+ antiporter subunit E